MVYCLAIDITSSCTTFPDADGDGDGVTDACDVCSSTITGMTVDEDGCPPFILGDLDRDGDVDQMDFALFQVCTSGFGTPADPNYAN